MVFDAGAPEPDADAGVDDADGGSDVEPDAGVKDAGSPPKPELPSSPDEDRVPENPYFHTDQEPVTGEDLFAVRIRYRDPDADAGKLIESSYDLSIERPQPSVKFYFAATVSEFAMQLRYSQYIPDRSAALLTEQVDLAVGADAEGAVAEFRDMIEIADALPCTDPCR